VEFYGLEEVDKAVAAIQGREEKSLLARPNVIGVGVGRKTVAGFETDEPCLLVLVSRKLQASELAPEARIPTLVEHCKTDVIEVGSVTASETLESTTMGANSLSCRVRPAQGGFSVGRVAGSSGSIAAGVIDADSELGPRKRYYLLGSNSVLAALNEGQEGDPILQPSAPDGGTQANDTLGRLARFVPLHFDEQPNFVDAAIAEVSFSDLDRSVFWIGHAVDRAPRVRIGQTLQKTGRSSCYSTGVVKGVNVTLAVSYADRKARFRRQILTTPLATAGEGGSLALDSARRAVGLTLAASSSVTVVSPIGLVESLLNIRVGW
jgi:hypothetical protein